MSYYKKAAEIISQHEGFVSKAMWDVNAYRIGYGSDTLTLPDGTYRKVVSTDTTTKELAVKDLTRRIPEFESRIKNQIGSQYWDKLPDEAKIGLISLAYNYGSIPKKEIIDAARKGDIKAIANAVVQSTYNDNSKLGTRLQNALRKRRQEEANYILQALTKVKQNIIPIAIVTSVVGIFGYILYKSIIKKK